jgi:hypothetical protein
MKIHRPQVISASAIVLAVAASLAAPGARAQCLQSDNFSGATYGPEWSYIMQNGAPWPYIANLPVPSTNNVLGRYLVLGASPYANASDLWPDVPTPNYQGSVLLQPVNPNADWTITTEIAAYMPPVSKSSAGLVLATQLPPFSSGNQMWRVAEYESPPPPAYGGAGGNQVTGLYYPTGSLVNNSQYENQVSFTSSAIYLQVTKSGQTYTVS